MTRHVVLAGLLVLAVASPASAEPAVMIEGIEYASPGGHALRLDAYVPSSLGPHPAVVVLHGGGWSRGGRGEAAFVGRRLAQAGFAAFAPDYRLAPEHPFPAALRDVRAAVRWIRSHAAEYDVDPARVAAFGGSAGGHLAAMLAVGGSGPLSRDARVSAAVSWSGPMDLSRAAAASAHPAVRGELRSMVDRFLGCAGGAACEVARRSASPIAHVDPSDAPLLLVTSEYEALPMTQAERMAEALEAAGVGARLIQVPGTRHAEQYAGVVVGAWQETVFAESLGFLSEWVDGFGPPNEAPRRLMTGLLLLGVLLTILLWPRRRHPVLALAPDGSALSRIDGFARTATPAREIERVLSEGGTPAA